MADQALHRTIGRPLNKPFSIFDLKESLKDLKAEPPLDREGRNAIILHKEPAFKVLLVAVRRGCSFPPHKTAAPMMLHVIEGALSVNSSLNDARLRAGELLTIHSGVVHEIRAVEDASFLLTLGSES